MTIQIFDECALMMLMIFIITGILRHEYSTRSNIIFNVIVWMIFWAVFFDLAGGSITNHSCPTEFSRKWAWIFNYLYFFFHNLILPAYILYIYSSIDIWHIFVKSRVGIPLMAFLCVVDELVLLLNTHGLDVFQINEAGQYQRGPWISFFYFIAVIWILWCLRILFMYRKLFNKDKFIVLLFLFVVIIGGVVCQFFVPNVTIEGFSMTLSLLFYIVMVKREENQIDPISGAYIYMQGIEKVTKNFRLAKPTTLIFVGLANNSSIHLHLGTESYNSFLHYITYRLKGIARDCGYPAELYYLENGLFALLSDSSTEKKNQEVAQMCVDAFKGDTRFEDITIFADARVCVVSCPEDIDDFSTLLTLATTYCGSLSESGRVFYYRDLKNDREFRINNEMDEILRRAVESGGLRVYYQPIYSVKEQRFIAAEALIRLRDREYGFIPPAKFIKAAESTGAIREIGDFVLRDVCRFISKHDMDELGLRYIEINLSPAQCMERKLFEKIRNMVEEYNISPDMIGFELTEGESENQVETIDRNIRKMHAYGFKIALDDYGTGYSNIKRVTELPIDQIKLNKKFADMNDDPGMWIMIKDTINMLRDMGKEILVVGVENESTAQKFSAAGTDLMQGCELQQGFFFCKPIPADEFVAFLKSH